MGYSMADRAIDNRFYVEAQETRIQILRSLNALKQAQLPEDAFRALAIGETLVVPLGHLR